MSNNKKERRRIGDRRDAKLIRDIDPMHIFTPILYPNRCDNESYISDVFFLDNTLEYIRKKNENINGDKPKYSLFFIVVAAFLKIGYVRPKMNRFIQNSNLYQRNEVSAAFVVKKEFKDDGEEALAFIHTKPEFTIDDIYEELVKEIENCRSDKLDSSSESMEKVGKLPRWILKAYTRFIMHLDKKGRVPKKYVASDPYYSSFILTNLGSIKLHSGYHHLTNWGTTSCFVAVGERKKRPFYSIDGTLTMKETLDVGVTIDERIADGYYYSKTIRVLKYIIEHPEILEEPLSNPVVGF